MEKVPEFTLKPGDLKNVRVGYVLAMTVDRLLLRFPPSRVACGMDLKEKRLLPQWMEPALHRLVCELPIFVLQSHC